MLTCCPDHDQADAQLQDCTQELELGFQRVRGHANLGSGKHPCTSTQAIASDCRSTGKPWDCRARPTGSRTRNPRRGPAVMGMPLDCRGKKFMIYLFSTRNRNPMPGVAVARTRRSDSTLGPELDFEPSHQRVPAPWAKSKRLRDRDQSDWKARSRCSMVGPGHLKACVV